MAITMATMANHKGNNNGHDGNDKWPYMPIIRAMHGNTNGNNNGHNGNDKGP